MYHRESKFCRLLVWKLSDLQIGHQSIALDALHLEPSEIVIRIFGLSESPHSRFLLVTNFGKMSRFTLGTDSPFADSSNGSQCGTERVRFVKAHRLESESVHISMVWTNGKMDIFHFDGAGDSVRGPVPISIPNDLTFYDSANGDDDDLKQSSGAVRWRIVDYDLSMESAPKMSVFALCERGTVHRFGSGKRCRFELGDRMEVSALTDGRKVAANNRLFGVEHSSLLSYGRIHCVESVGSGDAAQFMVIGPHRSEFGTLALWTLESVNGGILERDWMPLIAQSATAKLLWIAPVISVLGSESVTVYAVTSKQTVSVGLPLFGQSLVHRIRASMHCEGAAAAEGAHRKMAFLESAEVMMERAQWTEMKELFERSDGMKESDLLLVLSLMLSHWEYRQHHDDDEDDDNEDDGPFMAAFDAVLSSKFNGIFMKRSLEILGQIQVQRLLEYLWRSLKRERSLSIEAVINWLSIALDAHSGTLAFCSGSNAEEMRRCIEDIGDLLKRYDLKMESMMSAEAQIHSILHLMAAQKETEQRSDRKRSRRETAKTEQHGADALLFESMNDGDADDDNENDGNRNESNSMRDYVVEYIKL